MKKALVIAHFYYENQVSQILKHIHNIPLEYDFYCTIGNKDNFQHIRQQILKHNKDAHILDVSNVGYDIWPFVFILNQIDLDDYTYIIKLHTKRDMPGCLPTPLGNGYFVGPGDNWRENLYCFIKNKRNIQKCIEALESPDIGMCTRFNLIHGMANAWGVLDEAKQTYPTYILNMTDFSFVAGTMFIAKSEPFKLLQNMHITESLFDAPTQDHRTQFAHVIERTMGEIIYKSGMRIADPFTDPKHIKKITAKYRQLKYIKRVINICVFPIFVAKFRRILRTKLCDWLYISYLSHIIKTDNYYEKKL